MYGTTSLEPDLLLSQREELGHLAYFLAEWRNVRDRGLIAPDVYETVAADYARRRAAIERSGLYRAALARARQPITTTPSEALHWAERARQIDPERAEAPALVVDLLCLLGRTDDAIALCEEAAGRFPELRDRLDDLRRRQAAKPLEDLLAQARMALKAKRDTEAILVCERVLALVPDDPPALVLLAFAHRRLNHVHEALALYERLSRLEPENPSWRKWVIALRAPMTASSSVPAGQAANRSIMPNPAPQAAPSIFEVEPSAEAALTWQNVAGEFLLDHWQKLILGLAVLLIVVSSNVGVYQIVGPKLWSSEGKCMLALAYTTLCAVFGVGLLRWGAERAGRMMLLTTLIVVPANFMLIGQIRLLLEPTAFGLAVTVLDGAALFALTRVVTATLGLKRGGLFLTVALFALSVFNAMTARGTPFSWGLAGLLAPSGVFLAAVVWLNARFRAETADEERDFTHFALALLTFAFLSGAIRTGVYVLQPAAPCLFAVSVMLLAMACVHTAHHLGRFEKDPRQAFVLRFGGTVLALLAFALALSRPPSPSPLLSGNTLATAVLGLALFATMLCAYRQPSYLYLAFAALFVGYFGAFYFLVDLLRAVEEVASSALGYRHKLPLPFKSLNGLVFNTTLAALSLVFAKRWGDARLARHCHWIGLPLSVGACVLACFEPKAAVLCLSGYAILYGVATWLFGQPRLIYLACATLLGALSWGTSLVPAATTAAYALVAVGCGSTWCAIRIGQRQLGVSCPYRNPLLHAALIAAGVALALGVTSGPTPGSVWALGLVALLCVVLHLDEPHSALLYLAALSGNLAYELLVACGAARWGWTIVPEHHATILSGAALGFAVLGALLRRAGAAAHPFWAIALAEVALGSILCLAAVVVGDAWAEPVSLAILGLALALGMLALIVVSVWGVRSKTIAALAVTFGASAYVAGAMAGLMHFSVQPLGAWLAVALGLLGLALDAAGRDLRTRSIGWLYFDPLWRAALIAAGAVWLVCAPNWDQYVPVALAIGLSGLILAIAMGERPSPALAHLALLALLVVWLCVFEITNAGVAAPLPNYGVWIAGLSLVLLAVSEGVVRSTGGTDPDFALRYVTRARVFAEALPVFSLAIALVAVGLAVWDWTPSGMTAAVLALASLVVFWTTRKYREAALAYAGIALAVASALVECAAWQRGAPVGFALGGLALTSAFAALTLWGAGVACARRRRATLYREPCWNSAAALTVAAFALALNARFASRASFPVASAALLVNVVACVLLAVVRRNPGWTLAAAGSFVAATYVVLLSVGRSDPRLAYVLGLAAALQAILFWTIGWACRRGLSGEWDRVLAAPLFACVVGLTLLAIPPAYHSPVSMVVVALAFVLLVKSFPRADWLYPALASLGCALYFAWLDGLPYSRLAIAAVVAAYAVWCLGVLLRRYRRPVRAVLGAVECEFPCFNAAIILGVIAASLRIAESLNRSPAWGAQTALACALAFLCLLMLTSSPHRCWVHGSVALFTLGATMLAVPRVTDPIQWLLVGMVLANGWFLVCRAARRLERTLCLRLHIRSDGYATIPGRWSIVLSTVTAALTGGLVILATMASLFGDSVWPAATSGTWWGVGVTLSLVLLYVLAVGPRLERNETLMTVWLLFVLGVWWLGTPASPLVTRGGVNVLAYLPLSTATLALLAIHASLGPTSAQPSAGSWMFGTVRARGLGTFLTGYGVSLTLAAALFTRGDVASTTVGTLAIGAFALGTLAVASGHDLAAYGAASFIGSACAYASLVIADRLGVHARPGLATALALGGAAAVWSLEGLAAAFARRRPRLARACEQSSLAGAFLTLLAVSAARSFAEKDTDVDVFLGVGVLMILCVHTIVLSARWRREWLVYVAQTLLIGAYFAYRSAFGLTPATDAAVLTLFGYLDLAVAEVMQRMRLNLYARPTLYFSLVVPLVPLATALADGRVDDLNLMFIMMAATFYSVACYKMQWKTLGYAAAILYNVFLWILWARAGYKLVDHSQFFLIPVGFSAILFAEVNRHDLGRPYVNTIRGLGLVVVYLSLAAPIWQFESFGAWLTLLLLSLAGVFAGIGLRVQSFLWLGLVCFVLDVVYQLGRLGYEHALAKWGIMLALGILLVLFVALNEKKRIVMTMRGFYDRVRQWE